MLVPRLVQSVREGRPITLQGQDGIRINPTHVTDAVSAIANALTLKSSQKINVGGPDVLSLRQIGEVIGQAVGREPLFQIDEETPPRHLVGDIQKMTRLVGASQVHFAEGIRLLVAQEEQNG
jgi:UDP-glucose 4-epimerase